MAPEDKGAGGSDNTPPGAVDAAALQAKLEKITGELGDLQSQYDEAKRRSAGKDTVITDKVKQIDELLGRLGAAEAEGVAKAALSQDQINRLLTASGSLEGLVKEQQTQTGLLQAELAKQKAETNRLLAISKAGIAPELIDLVPASEDPAVLEANIKKMQAAQKAISDKAREEAAKYGVLPGAPQHALGETGVVVDLDKLFGGIQGNQALLEAAQKAADAVKSSGLTGGDGSWMKETRVPIEA